MCGIIGVTGAPEACDVLLAGLELLEYRGYDSAGLVLVDRDVTFSATGATGATGATASPTESAGATSGPDTGNLAGSTGTDPVRPSRPTTLPHAAALWRRRAAEHAGSLARLREQAIEAPESSGAALGHTRWATHGPPTADNAHPHLDCTGRLALVHNGIIENYRDLATTLDADGHKRTSATDSEVLVHLVESELESGISLAEAVRRCLSKVRGDFAIALVSASEPDTIVAARRTSPLVVGRTDAIGVVASEVAAALATTRELYSIADDQIAEVGPGTIVVRNIDGTIVDPAPIEVSWSVQRAMKGGYADFMSKEIHEQPQAVRDTLLSRIAPSGTVEIEELALTEEALRRIERVVLVACGSSYHASLVAAQSIERWAGIPASAEIASEFRYREAMFGDGVLVVAVSQSGETVDTLHAMREARRRGASVVALTNVVDSVMSREADGVLYTRAGPEIGVASTKSHVAQMAMLEVFALYLAQITGWREAELLRETGRQIAELPEVIERVVAGAAHYKDVAKQWVEVEDFYFLGRRAGLPTAMEGALKLKELAYVRAEAYAAGEMKHGPISLIEPGAVVVVVATRTPLWEKVMANVEEMRARGATVLAVADVDDHETASLVDAVFAVPHVLEECSPIINVVPLQCLAYAVARGRGNDVDRPRNLAKVVTVE